MRMDFNFDTSLGKARLTSAVMTKSAILWAVVKIMQVGPKSYFHYRDTTRLVVRL